MSAIRRRHFRIPVLSRLTMAWLGAFGAVVMAGAGYFATSGKGPGRVSLPVEEIEIFARPQLQTPAREERLEAPGVKLASPDLRDEAPVTAALEGADSSDILEYPEEFSAAEQSGDIVITIAGAGRSALAPTAASLTRSPAAAVADPDPQLLRPTPFGKAPKIASDGRRAMNVYAMPYRNGDDLPEIAMIVGGLGLNPAITEKAIDELPPEISLSFAPYAKDLEFWSEKARKAGHEVLIELPMEGYGGNPQALGAAGLLTTRQTEENLQRLDWLMSRFGGYFAATNYMGAKFSANEESLAPVLQKLRDAGVAYFDDTGAAPARHGSGVGAVSKVIPPAPEESKRTLVRRELEALERAALRDGGAIGKTYAYAPTLDEIIDWTKSLEGKGLKPAPASAVLRNGGATR